MNQCRKCRRAGEKLYLKGERCYSPKCALVKRNNTPGFQGKDKRFRRLSSYGEQLKEKQKLRHSYNLKERKFKRYVKEAMSQRGKGGNSQDLLVKALEKRLDNVVFRMGIASSRRGARQIVGHGHLLVNGRKVDIPSYELNKGDKITVKESSLEKEPFVSLKARMEGYTAPSWVKFNLKSQEGEVVGEPTIEEAAPPADLPLIFEYYSR